jgi:putative transposase
MSATAIKTLEATLATPTQHKECKLRETVATYRTALEHAFESGETTKTGVNNIVTEYDLTSYAKDALKQYVPQLQNTYDASEISDDHPVRFTSRGWNFDHDSSRHHEYCWRVPRAGRGTSYWIPLQINPSQRDLWERLDDDDTSVGEFRLIEHNSSWMLHVTVEFDVPDTTESEDPTPVGFDIGESTLVAGCACTGDDTTTPFLFDGSDARRYRKQMHTTLQRLQRRDATQWRIDNQFEYFQNALTDMVETATRRAVEYAQSFTDPIIVMEDLSFIREDLDYGKFMNRRLHAWAFSRLQGRIEDKASEVGIPVRYVNAYYTSQICHVCNHVGNRSGQAEFQCSNNECWVSEYQADVNAAYNIGHRYNAWGESLPVKSGGDDIPRDGSACDSTTEQ